MRFFVFLLFTVVHLGFGQESTSTTWQELYQKGLKLKDSLPEKACEYFDKAIQSHSESSISEQSISLYVERAECLSDGEEFEQAIEIYDFAIRSYESNNIQDEGLLINALFGSAAALQSLGHINKTIEALDRIITITEHDENLIQDYLFALVYSADPYDQYGMYNKSIEVQEKALKIIEDNMEDYGGYYPTMLNNLAVTYQNIRDYESALALNKKAYDLYDKNSESYPTIVSTLAGSHVLLGQYKEALEYYKEAFAVPTIDLGDSIMIYNGLGKLYQESSQFNYAADNFKLARDLYKNNISNNDLTFQQYNNDYASALIEVGEGEKALKIFANNLKLIVDLNETKTEDYFIKLYNYGYTFYRLERFSEAVPFMEKAVDGLRQNYGIEHPQYAWVANGLAGNYLGLGELEKARQLYESSNTIYLNQMDKVFRFSNEKDKEKFLLTLKKNFNELQQLASKYDYSIASLNEINLNNQLILKGLLLRESNNIIQGLSSLNKPETTNQLAHYDSIRYAFENSRIKNLLRKNEETERLQRSLDSMETQLVKAYNENFNSTETYKIDWKEIQKSLKEDEVIVEFAHYKLKNTDQNKRETEYLAYIFDNTSSEPLVIRLFKEQELLSVLDKLSKNEFYLSTEAYQLIWDPLLEAIGDASSIFFVPSGILNQISFSALYNGENPIVINFNLYQLGSSSDKLKDVKQPDLDNALFIGGIDYEYQPKTSGTDKQLAATAYETEYKWGTTRGTKTRGETWNYLPGTKTELENISNIYKESEFNFNSLTGGQATEYRLKNLDTIPSILHIATHGYFFENYEGDYENDETLSLEDQLRLSDDPFLRSGILFSGANYAWRYGDNPYEAENGILTASEIKNLNLGDTALVVLSACETGLGDINGWEGVYGLQRAFKLAGVDKLIMSLWKVPDAETAEFMTGFYANAIKYKDINQAFIETQRTQAKKYFKEPLKWAGFVLME